MGFLLLCFSVDERDEPPGVDSVALILLREGISEHGLFRLNAVPIAAYHRKGDSCGCNPIACGDASTEPQEKIPEVARMTKDP